MKSCTMLAVQADGRDAHDRRGARARAARCDPIQAAFKEEHGLQCGFCTPGMMLVGAALLDAEPEPDRGRDPLGDLRQHLPLHRLHEHRQGDPARGRGRSARDRGSAVMTTAAAGSQHGDHARASAASATRSSARRTTASSHGQGNYLDDIILPGMLHMAILRSPHAHARIKSIDTSAASAMPRRGRGRHRRADGAAQPRVDADAVGRHPGGARHRQGAVPGPGGRGRRRRPTRTSPRTRSS